jgi:hypothetical protein
MLAKQGKSTDVSLRSIVKSLLFPITKPKLLALLAEVQELIQWLKETGSKRSQVLRSLLYYTRKYYHELELICDEIKLKRELVVLSSENKQILDARFDVWEDAERRVLHPTSVTVSLTALPAQMLQVRVEWSSESKRPSVMTVEMDHVQLQTSCVHSTRPMLFVMGKSKESNVFAQLALARGTFETLNELLE